MTVFDKKEKEFFEKEIKEIKEFLPLSEDDLDLKLEIERKISFLKEKLEEIKEKKVFAGKYDKGPAILEIHAGTGGKDAEDFVGILARMYQKFCQKKGFVAETLYLQEGEGGIKSISFKIKGKYAYGLLKKEKGVHRLVRISPFSKKGLRHTSFALVEVFPVIKEGKNIEIKDTELEIQTFKASGPGGQYVNKRETAVRIIHLPTGISVTCQKERSLEQNKKTALEILKMKIYLLKEKEKEEKLKKEKGKIETPSWGRQKRSYIFHPYKLVRDEKTGYKTKNLEKVLEGDLDEFLFL